MHIPNEIYLIIFDHLVPLETCATATYLKTLSNLIEVCRFFRSVCLPRRIDCLSCRGSQKNHVDFCRAITEPPFIAKKLLEHVRHLNFHDWMPRSEESAWVNQAILKKYVTVIGDFIRVRSLQLDRVTISKAFFREVVNMFSLRDVVIANCTFEAYDSEKDAPFRKKPIVPWTSIVFDSNSNYEPYLPTLAKLTASRHLMSFTTRHWDVAQAVLSFPVDFQLIHLSVPFGSPDTTFLRTFLSHTPSIQRLCFPTSIDLHNFRSVPKLNLPPNALPNLYQIQCPSYYLGEFVTGRPVSIVDVSAFIGFEDPETPLFDQDCVPTVDAVSTLARSTASVRFLAISADMFACFDYKAVFEPIAQLDELLLYIWWDVNIEVSFPTVTLKILVSLTLSIAMIRWCFVLLRAQTLGGYLMHDNEPVHHTVRTVSICFRTLAPKEPYSLFATSYNLVLERHLIRNFFAEAFPNAITISFRKQIEWRRIGRLWIPVVVLPEFVKQSLVSMSKEETTPLVRDHAGCLEGLFEKEELTRDLRILLGTLKVLEDDHEELINIV